MVAFCVKKTRKTKRSSRPKGRKDRVTTLIQKLSRRSSAYGKRCGRSGRTSLRNENNGSSTRLSYWQREAFGSESGSGANFGSVVVVKMLSIHGIFSLYGGVAYSSPSSQDLYDRYMIRCPSILLKKQRSRQPKRASCRCRLFTR